MARPTTRAALSLSDEERSMLEVQKILGHYSILTTARYTHLTSHTNSSASVRINALMSSFSLHWGVVK